MAITPGGRVGDASPTGKKGGKRRLSDQERELWHALRRKGVPAKRAYAMTIGIVRNAATLGKWGRGKVRNPAVKAAATASVARRKATKSLSQPGTLPAMATTTPALALALAAARARGMDLSDFDLVGPKGYVHGWKFVGAPGLGAKVRHSRYGTKSSSVGGREKAARKASGISFPKPGKKAPAISDREARARRASGISYPKKAAPKPIARKISGLEGHTDTDLKRSHAYGMANPKVGVSPKVAEELKARGYVLKNGKWTKPSSVSNREARARKRSGISYPKKGK